MTIVAGNFFVNKRCSHRTLWFVGDKNMHIHDNELAFALDQPSVTPPSLDKICDGKPEPTQNTNKAAESPI